MNGRILTLVAAVMVVGLVGPALPVSAADIAVSIRYPAFHPNPVNANVGDSVTWTNGDSFNHTVTADNGSFDSGPLAGGQSFTIANIQQGFTYHCTIHPFMKGTVNLPLPLQSVSPQMGSVRGGTALTLRGNNFLSGSTVRFTSGSLTATAPATYVSAAVLTATTPPLPADGHTDVAVLNPDGTLHGSLSAAFWVYDLAYSDLTTQTGVFASTGSGELVLIGSVYVTPAPVPGTFTQPQGSSLWGYHGARTGVNAAGAFDAATHRFSLVATAQGAYSTTPEPLAYASDDQSPQ
ncbi:MAG: IPT/TIG domain-containing protein [Candidatus Dormibacteria bacterium]